jgi:SNF2 family DNA or RNA helicase
MTTTGSFLDWGAFHGTLTPHQEAGVGWLLDHPHAVLADDVGLGKTVQALAYIAKLEERGHLFRLGQSRCRVLWLTDATLIEQTKAEIERFLPDFTVATNLDPELRGSNKGRAAYEVRFGLGPDILVMGYEMAHSRRHWLQTTRPALVVLDEAMKLKGGGIHFNTATEYTKRSERVLTITATPLENDPMELWHLLKVTRAPGLWPKPEFQRDFVTWRTVRVNQQWGTTKRVPEGWMPGREAEVRQFLSNVLLRRSGEDVGLALPQRVGTRESLVKLSTAQAKAYESASRQEGLRGHQGMQAASRAVGAESALVDALIQALAWRSTEQAVVYCETLAVLDLVPAAWWRQASPSAGLRASSATSNVRTQSERSRVEKCVCFSVAASSNAASTFSTAGF